MLVKFERPNDQNVAFVAENIREADRIEIWEMSRHTPIQSITKGLEMSNLSAVAVINDIPCAVYGLVQVDILQGIGVPWLLGTDYAVENRRIFLKYCKQGLSQMLDMCPNLLNYVHAENLISIRWLKYMGFTIEQAAPVGHNGAMFHRFTVGSVGDV